VKTGAGEEHPRHAAWPNRDEPEALFQPLEGALAPARRLCLGITGKLRLFSPALWDIGATRKAFRRKISREIPGFGEVREISMWIDLAVHALAASESRQCDVHRKTKGRAGHAPP
jgi:hypothetical protein